MQEEQTNGVARVQPGQMRKFQWLFTVKLPKGLPFTVLVSGEPGEFLD